MNLSLFLIKQRHMIRAVQRMTAAEIFNFN